MTATVKAAKARRLPEKRVNKILAEYDLPGKVRAHLATLGPLAWAKPAGLPRGDRNGVGYWLPARHREWVVLTSLGPLGVSVYDDWIPCVFDDADLGRVAGATVPSGKWNHHAFAGYCHGPTSREEILGKLDTMFADFKRRLGWITGRYQHPEGWISG